MDILQIFGAIAGVAWAASLLVIAGLRHARDVLKFQAIVTTHQIVPFRFVKVATVAFISVQLATGAAGLAAVAFGWSGRVGTTSLWALTLVYFFMLAYVTTLILSGRSVACGCFGSDELAGTHTLARVALGVAFPLALIFLPDNVSVPSAWVAMAIGIVLAAYTTKTPRAERPNCVAQNASTSTTKEGKGRSWST